MIDNQQVKYKISIPFSASRSFTVLVSRPLWIGGGLVQKRQPGRADFGEVVRPAYPPPAYPCPAYPRPAYPPPIIPHLILPITSRISSSPNIPHTSSQPYHLPSHLICYSCDIIKT